MEACPVDFLPAAYDYIHHGHPSAAVEDPDGQDIRNDLPFDGGAFAVLGEDRSFGTKTPCHRKAFCEK